MKTLADLQLDVLEKLKALGFQELLSMIVDLEVGAELELDIEQSVHDKLVEGQSICVNISWGRGRSVRVRSIAVDLPESDSEMKEINSKLGIFIPVHVESAEWHGGFDIFENDRIVDWHRMDGE